MSRIAKIKIDFDPEIPSDEEWAELRDTWYDLLCRATDRPRREDIHRAMAWQLAEVLAGARLGSAICHHDVLVIDDPEDLEACRLHRDNKSAQFRRRLIESIPGYPDARVVLRQEDGQITSAEVWMGGAS